MIEVGEDEYRDAQKRHKEVAVSTKDFQQVLFLVSGESVVYAQTRSDGKVKYWRKKNG